MKKNEKLQYASLAVHITCEVVDIVKRFLPEEYYTTIGITNKDIFELADKIRDEIIEDMVNYAESDPAAKNDYDYVYSACKGFEAMKYYRIAHVFATSEKFNDKGLCQGYFRTLARKITEEAKVRTGIDINPVCKIGKGCVIDHGVGTRIGYEIEYSKNTNVFGETAIIGDNCIILNDVVIGAYKVNQGQVDGRRQPKIGNNVTICSGARILGSITIGDNVFIGTGVIICHDVPSDSRVTLRNQYQITMASAENIQATNIEIDGIIKDDLEGILILGGKNLDNITINLVDSTTYENCIVDEPITILSNNGRKVFFKLPQNFNYIRQNSKIMLQIMNPNLMVSYFYSEVLNREL